MRSSILTWLKRTSMGPRHTAWSRLIRIVAIIAVVLTGSHVAVKPFAEAGSLDDRYLTVTPEAGPDPRLEWLGPRLELDRSMACFQTYLETRIATAGEPAGALESSPPVLRPAPSPRLSARLEKGQRACVDERENRAELQSEEIVIGDDDVDPFEEQAEPIDDPWETFNSRNFEFNRSVDRYVFKPIATGYDWIVPGPVEEAIGRVFDNVRFVPRFVNNLAQGKGKAAGIELGRFFINSTVGVAGLFDVAQAGFGLDKPEAEDTGQTLAVHGVHPGPYLVLPFLPPTTVRDGVGTLVDLVLDPLNLLLPLVPQLATRSEELLNERSRNLQRFAGVEEATVDLYAAVRDAYRQTRIKAIRK